MWVWTWSCCGNLWELIPSRRYPERNSFQPRCPDCGAQPTRRWVNTKHEMGSVTEGVREV